MSKVSVRGVTKRYGSDYALKNFSFDFPDLGIVAILGRSGSGKSTLLNIISGMDKKFDGNVLVLNKPIKTMDEAETTEFRMRNIGYVFQSFNLIELETAFDNVFFPIDALYGDEPANKKARANDLLKFVGMQSKANQLVNTLSGGEKQRIAFARALAADPKILLCDEPTASLDKTNAEKVFDVISEISKKRLVIVVTHDEELAYSFADKVIRISGGELQNIEDVHRDSSKNLLLPTMRMKHAKEIPSLSSPFIWRHSKHLIKNRRIRSLISRASISAGLVGLGLSIYVATSISDEIGHAFEAIVPENQVVVEKRMKPDQLVTNIYSAGRAQIEYLCEKYPDEITDWGTSVMLDYESVFKDDDSFALISGGKTITLAGFYSRLINDFLWLDDSPDLQVYPSCPATMDNDDVVLGLPYSNMANLCYSLGILRTYDDLGKHISKHGLQMLLFLANEDIGFYNEDLFSIRGVVASPAPCLYHLNHRWNHEYFINHLNFRSSLTEETPNIQTVLEIPYLRFDGDMSSLLEKTRSDSHLETLIFEKASEEYLPSVCGLILPCDLPRYYAFSCDRNGLGGKLMDSLANHPLNKGSMICSQTGFFATTDSFLQGFAMKFYISNDRESLFEVKESASSVAKELASRPIDLPSSVVDGCFASGAGAFRVSANLTDLVAGRAPQGVDEVVLSSSLYERFGGPQSIFVSAQVNEESVGNRVTREFKDAELKVVGVVKSNRDGIYVDQGWTIDFFTDRLGVSPFRLEPSGMVLCFNGKKDVAAYMDEMAKMHPDLVFYSPSDDASDSVSETSGYIGTVLSVFSAIALAMSSLLFSIVMVITIGENDKEAKLLHALGVSSDDVARIYRAVAFHYALQSFLAAGVALLLCELVAKKFIADAFGVAYSLQISWTPFASVAGFVIVFLVVMSIYIRKKSKKSF